MKIHLTIAESLGTDNEFSSEVFVSTSEQEACELASSLIADMIKTMYDGDQEIDPTRHWELEGDDWFYRVRTESYEIPNVDLTSNTSSGDEQIRAYAVDIDWDTDDEEDIDLPSRVEIPFNVDDDEIADYLSDTYGFCVFGFDIVQK